MTILLPYLLLLLLAFLLQRSLIYFPEKQTEAQQKQIIAQLKLKLWPSTDHYRALISENPLPTVKKGTVLVFHGNAGSAAGRSYYIEALERLGYRVLLAEYPGFGTRPGKPSESVLIADGVETAKLAYKQFGEPLFLWGESLGSGVVSGIISSQQVPIAGTILLMPFDSMTRVAQRHYWYLLAGLLTLDKYNNVKNLNGYKGNKAVILSEEDAVIPNAHTLRLFDSLPQPKKLWTFKNVGHNDWPSTATLPWWHEVMAYVSQDNSSEQ